jgi:hypothetical protein
VYPAAAGSPLPYTSKKIKYPGYNATAESKAPRRSGTLQSHPASPWVVGNFGNTAETYRWLIRVDPDAAAMTDADTLSLGSALCSFAFDQKHPHRVAALTRDGRVHVVTVDGWKSHRTLALLPDGGTTCPGAFVVGEGFAYVSPNGSGVIHEVDLNTLEVSRLFTVGGDPSSLAVATRPAP